MRRMGLIVAASTTVMLAACGGSKGTDRDTTAAGTATSDTASMAGMSHDTGAMGSTAGMNGNSKVPASAKEMTDAEVFAMVKQVNVGEIAAGKMARTKATNSDVKSFASDMVSAHTRMLDMGMSLGKTLGAKDKPAAEDSIAKANMEMASHLTSTAKGAAFDKAYIDAQVMGHQAALQFVQNAAGQAKNADLKKMLTDAQPDIQKHLDRAKQLQGKMGK